jgi:hypothetical protein
MAPLGTLGRLGAADRGSLVIDGVPRPDHGPGYTERVCPTCDAGWVGQHNEECGWCHRRAQLDLELARSELLQPSHLNSDVGNPNYDRLDDVTKQVWDRTRGQRRGEHSIAMWIARLGQAVGEGWITAAEADHAIRRVTR